VSRRRYQVRYTGRAWADLARLIEFSAEEDEERAREIRDAIVDAIRVLELLPFTARPALLAERATLRELIVPFGSTGHVILFSVQHGEVTVLRMRHQREQG